MAILSHDAQADLDRYLQQMRASLRGHTSIDIEDVERDVRGHVDAALDGRPEPIDARSLQEVLRRLGAPEQWVPDDDLPTWRRLATRRSGMPDWLAFLGLICAVAGPFLFLVEGGPVLWPLPVVLMIAAFVLARASASALASSQSIATRRWLLFPPLLAWYVPLGVLLLAWPVGVILGARADFTAFRQWLETLLPASLETNTTVVAAMAVGGWWIALGILAGPFNGVLRAVFWPFAESLSRRHAIAVIGLGALLIAIASVSFIVLS